MNKKKKILFLVVFNFAALLLILHGFEYTLSPYKNLPENGRINGQYYTWGHLVSNNSHGFREREFEIPKPSNIFRVMVLGDSLTWGAGLSVDERYTAIAEKQLNRNTKTKTFEVLNFGVSGGPTTLERDILLKFKDIVEPDLIVVAFCLNDPQPRGQDYSIEREQLRKSFSGRMVRGVSKSLWRLGLPHLSNLTNKAFYASAEKAGKIPLWNVALQRTYKPASSEWKNFVQALSDIKRTSDELGLPSPIFTILNQGTYTDRPTDYNTPDDYLKQFLKWYHQAEEAASSTGFITYNHENELKSQLTNESLAVNIMDGHPSANLNRIYGEKLSEYIQKQLK